MSDSHDIVFHFFSTTKDSITDTTMHKNCISKKETDDIKPGKQTFFLKL